MTNLMLVSALLVGAAPPAADLDPGDRVAVDSDKGEIRFPARVQHPTGKACIDAFGRRIQAFIGCEKSGGKRSEFADHFVFLASVDTGDVYRGLAEAGATTKVHFSRAEGKKRAGKDFLQGDPVAVSVAWKEGGRWVERPYESFVEEKTVVAGKEVVSPWAPHWVFHGSGVIHKEGTGCVACPCDCPGGLIADNRYPIYEPKPTVRFDLKKAPPEGARVVVRIRRVENKPR